MHGTCFSKRSPLCPDTVAAGVPTALERRSAGMRLLQLSAADVQGSLPCASLEIVVPAPGDVRVRACCPRPVAGYT